MNGNKNKVYTDLRLHIHQELILKLDGLGIQHGMAIILDFLIGKLQVKDGKSIIIFKGNGEKMRNVRILMLMISFKISSEN